MLFLKFFSVVVALCLLSISLPSTARAGCYEDVGCTDRDRFGEKALAQLSCRNLDFLRNSIYAENGYCFKNADYQHIFGNEYCRYDTSAAVPLADLERVNVLSIVDMEKTRGCRG